MGFLFKTLFTTEMPHITPKRKIRKNKIDILEALLKIINLSYKIEGKIKLYTEFKSKF